MSGDRTVTLPPEQQAAKIAFRDLVRAFGGQEAAAAETGKGQSRIAAYGLTNAADFPPLDVIMKLEDRTLGLPGWPHVTLHLCRRLGGMFVRLPAVAAPSTSWTTHVAALAKEAGELQAGICTDLSSANDVSPTEARGRLADAADLVRVAVQIEAALKARAEEQD